MKTRNTITKLITISMAVAAIATIGSSWAAGRAGAASRSDINDIFVFQSPVGIIPEQTLRISVANSTSSLGGPIVWTYEVRNPGGVPLYESGRIQVPAGEFRFSDVSRQALNTEGEPGTGRAQVMVRVTIQAPSGSNPEDFSGSLEGAFKQGVKWRVMATNPAQLADKPKQVRREMQFLAPEQAAAFIEAAKGDLYFVYFALALDTGARPSELFGLQWKDIDFEQGHISIQRSLEYPDYSNEFQFVEPKTARSRRSIKVAKQNLFHLREHRKAQGEIRLKKGAAWQAYDLVFSTRDGKPTPARNILRRHLRPILKAADLPQTLNLYSLRHSCATLL